MLDTKGSTETSFYDDLTSLSLQYLLSWILPFFHSFLIIFFTQADNYGQDSNKWRGREEGASSLGRFSKVTWSSVRKGLW